MEAENDKLKLVHKLWEWEKWVLIPQDLKYNFILSLDDNGKVAWHMAA